MTNFNQPGNPVPAKAKKRRSGVPAIWKYEEAVFDLTALRAAFAGKVIPPTVQQKIDQLTEKVRVESEKRKYKKKRAANNISCGKTSVMFFLKNPSLIPVMAREQNRRKQLEKVGEDLTYLELDNEMLCRHCWDRATFIYTQDESCGKNFNGSPDYRRIRSNYIYTMGRASRSAEMALQELARSEQERAQSKTQEPVARVASPATPVPSPTVASTRPTPIQEWTGQDELDREEAMATYDLIERRRAAAEKRRITLQDKKVWDEEQRIAQLLHNECNDDFDTEETTSSADEATTPAAKETTPVEKRKISKPFVMKPMFEERVFHDPEMAEGGSSPAKTIRKAHSRVPGAHHRFEYQR